MGMPDRIGTKPEFKEWETKGVSCFQCVSCEKGQMEDEYIHTSPTREHAEEARDIIGRLLSFVCTPAEKVVALQDALKYLATIEQEEKCRKLTKRGRP